MHDDVANYAEAARSNSMSKPVYQSIRSCLLLALAGTLKHIPSAGSGVVEGEESADLMGNGPQISPRPFKA